MAKAKWTVMVLMGANNLPNESDLTSFARSDLREMAKVGSRKALLNVVVQIDQKEKAGGPKRFFVKKGEAQELTGAADRIPPGQGSSGDPHVLEYFLRWAKKKYPADHYMLVLWGHAYRFAFERDGKDTLDFTMLSRVLQRTNKGHKLDIVAFDACNVTWIEGAYQLRDAANYLVASQFTDPLPGWPYHLILEKLRNAPDTMAGEDGPEDLGRAIISQFARYYVGSASVTMTVLDLRHVKEISNKVRKLADELISAVRDDRAEQGRVTGVFRMSHVQQGQPGVDLATLCWNLTNYSTHEGLRDAASAVGDLLFKPTKSLVVAHSRSDLNVAMLHGVSIFAPNVESGFENVRPLYEALDFARHTRWDELVFALAEPDY